LIVTSALTIPPSISTVQQKPSGGSERPEGRGAQQQLRPDVSHRDLHVDVVALAQVIARPVDRDLARDDDHRADDRH
jgi:hypothetical protein